MILNADDLGGCECMGVIEKLVDFLVLREADIQVLKLHVQHLQENMGALRAENALLAQNQKKKK